MTYEYVCEKCEYVFELDFAFGKAPKTVKCDDCKTSCSRHFGGMNFILKGGGWPSKKMSFNKEMTDRNMRAGKKTRDNHHSPKLIGHDYGGGDVREV